MDSTANEFNDLTMLQGLILPNDDSSEELFYRSDVSFKQKNLRLKRGESVSFDTYFNSFSYSKYSKFTTAQTAELRVCYVGAGTAELRLFDGEDKIISQKKLSSERLDNRIFRFELNSLSDDGFVYLKIVADDDFSLISADYYADASPNKISCCGIICTFKREDFLNKNLEALKSFKNRFFDKIYVIDNGNTLDAKQSDDFIKIIPNKNFGGSGGFTRGIIEAKRNEHTHFLLMDDDIIFYPETLERMVKFASILKPDFSKAWISAAMLSLEKDFLQWEMGGFWNGEGIEPINGGVDVRDKNTLLNNLRGRAPNYGAWWCLLMPTSVVYENGLPLPFFIKSDDLEYGLRAGKDNSIITMNGFAIRHEDFNSKFSFAVEYYDKRNILITRAVHSTSDSVLNVIKLFVHTCGKRLIMYHYKSIDLILLAYSDFLKGVSFFLDYDEEKYHKQISDACEKLIPLSEIPEFNENKRVKSVYDKRFYGKEKQILKAQIFTLGGHIIPRFLLKKEPAVMPINADKLQECFLRKKIVQYQPKGDDGIVSERNFFKFTFYGFKIFFMIIRLAFQYGKAKNNFLENYKKLTSEDFWAEHLGI